MTARLAYSGVNNWALAAKYSAIVWWNSKWSRPRLVNPTTSNLIPATRRSARACELTSIAMVSAPPSRITASIDCRSGDSGVVMVVRSSRSGWPPSRKPSVPILPTQRPAPSNADASISTVVDFPLVPVTPKLISARVG